MAIWFPKRKNVQGKIVYADIYNKLAVAEGQVAEGKYNVIFLFSPPFLPLLRNLQE